MILKNKKKKLNKAITGNKFK